MRFFLFSAEDEKLTPCDLGVTPSKYAEIVQSLLFQGLDRATVSGVSVYLAECCEAFEA